MPPEPPSNDPGIIVLEIVADIIKHRPELEDYRPSLINHGLFALTFYPQTKDRDEVHGILSRGVHRRIAEISMELQTKAARDAMILKMRGLDSK